MNPALLEVDGVVKHYDGVAAVDGATFSVPRSSITALIGPNGAGKSTLFNIVSGFVRPERGRITFAGARIDGWPPHRVAAAGLVRTFQTPKALTRMTVRENMLLAAPAQPGERLWRVALTPRAARRREREIEASARELLALVRLEQLADDYAGTLSGGQRKLLEFARALMRDPAILLLDEPMAGVNPVLAEQLLEHVLQRRRDHATTFLLVEHDVEMVMSSCDRVVVMNEGAVIADGPPAAVRGDPRVADAYLGSHEPSTGSE